MADNRTADAIVWDFGGVLSFSIEGMVDEVAAYHGVAVSKILEVLIGPRGESTTDHPWHRAERGEISCWSMQDELEPFAKAHGITLRGDEYQSFLTGDISMNSEAVAKATELHKNGYKTALLTNSFNEFRSVIEALIDFSIFDVVVDSAEVGCRKPEPQIYAIVEERLAVDPERIIYLDDFAGNIAGGKAAGWQTIHVSSPEQALADLDALLTGQTP